MAKQKVFSSFFLFNRSSTEDSESRGLSSFTALRLHFAMVSRRLIMGSGPAFRYQFEVQGPVSRKSR